MDDDDAADIRRKIAKAKAMERRLGEMQDRIRRQHAQLESVIRTIKDDDDGDAPADVRHAPRSRT